MKSLYILAFILPFSYALSKPPFAKSSSDRLNPHATTLQNVEGTDQILDAQHDQISEQILLTDSSNHDDIADATSAHLTTAEIEQEFYLNDYRVTDVNGQVVDECRDDRNLADFQKDIQTGHPGARASLIRASPVARGQRLWRITRERETWIAIAGASEAHVTNLLPGDKVEPYTPPHQQ